MATKTRILTALLAIAALAAVMAASVSASSGMVRTPAPPSGQPAWCPPLPSGYPVGHELLWIKVVTHNMHGDVMPKGYVLRSFNKKGQGTYRQPGAWSGCWVVQDYPKRHVPKRECIGIFWPEWTPPKQECQTAERSPSGWQMEFPVYYSRPK